MTGTSNAEMGGSQQPEADNTRPPLTIDGILRVLNSQAFADAWEDPRTEAGALAALARVEAELAAKGELYEPY
jgi:hypothetical protein